jgi:hypothetical protein
MELPENVSSNALKGPIISISRKKSTVYLVIKFARDVQALQQINVQAVKKEL